MCFDNVGGNGLTKMTRQMNWGGRMLPIGFTSGEISSVLVNLLIKNYSIIGAFWGALSSPFQKFAHVFQAASFNGWLRAQRSRMRMIKALRSARVNFHSNG